MDDLDKLVQANRPWPYLWIICRNAEGRRRLVCTRCDKRKRVPFAAEQDAAQFVRLAADFLVRHRGCPERVQ